MTTTLRKHRQVIGYGMIGLMSIWQVAQPLQGATVNWTAGSSTDFNWATSANWDIGVPTAADDVVFGTPVPNPGVLPTPSVITLGAGSVANSLRLRDNYTLVGGDLTLSTGGIHAGFVTSSTIGSLLSGVSGLTLTGGGAVRLTNATNTYTGTTTVADGSLIISAPGALGLSSSPVVVTGFNPVLTSTNLRGFGGGALVLDGTSGGMTFTRDLFLQGQGPISDRSAALVTHGNNTLSGIVTTAMPFGSTNLNTRITALDGSLILSGGLVTQGTAGTTVTSLGGTNQVGGNSMVISGPLSGNGTLEKSGGGVLHLIPSNASAFSGVLRVSGSAATGQSSVLITTPNVLGTSVAAGTGAVLDLNGGVLEVRMDSPSLLSGGSVANVYQRNNATIYADHANGSLVLNQVLTMGQLAFEENFTLTLASRNGYGMAFGAAPVQGGNNSSTITNNLAGTVTFTGNFWSNTENTANRTMTIGGNGNTLINGNVVASAAAFNHSLTKTGTGGLTIIGTGTTLDGSVNIQGGGVIITDFRSLNNATGTTVNIGTGGTGAALFIGTSAASSAAGLTSNKTINLAGTTGGATIVANQSGINPVIINSSVTATGAGIKTLTLSGSNAADNTIGGAIINNSVANTTALLKTGTGTWVLGGTNTYTGATTLANGTLKIKGNGASSTVLPSTNAVTFNANNGYSGATLDYVGPGGTSVQNLGALTVTAGANTIRLTPGSGTASLTFASLGGGVVADAASLNIITPDVNSKVTLTGLASGLVLRTFYGGNEFAYSNAGVIRAPLYGTDPGFVTSAVALSATDTTEITGSFATPTITIDALKINGTHTLTLDPASVLTVRVGAAGTDGMILSTGGDAIITGGSALSTGGSGSLSFRVDGALDTLTLATPLDAATTGGLTKSGAGTLILSAANAQTGTVSLNEGTIKLSGTGTLGAASDLTIRQLGVLDLNGVTPSTVTNAYNNNGVVTNSSATPVTFTVGGNNGTGTSWGFINQTLGAISVTKIGTGAQSWIGSSNYTGATTIGSTGLVSVDVLADIGVASGIGAGDATSDATNAASLVFNGSAAGLVFVGALRDSTVTLGATSASTNRLFTLAGTGATLSSTAANNNAIVWSNPSPIVHGIVGPQLITFTGTSAADNAFVPQLTDSGTGLDLTSVLKTGTGAWKLAAVGNTYTGSTTIQQGVLIATDGQGLPTASNLVFDGGTLMTQGNFSRELGAGPGQMRFAAPAVHTAQFAGGFVGGDSKLTVAWSGAPVWGDNANFISRRDALILNGSQARGQGASAAMGVSEVELSGNFDLGTNGISASFTGMETVSGSAVVTLEDTTGLVAGQAITGTNLPARAYILSVDGPNQITISATATGSGISLASSVTPVGSAASFTAMATTNATATVTVDSTAGLVVGQTITGTNIPAGAYIISINSSTQVTISANASATGTGLAGAVQALPARVVRVDDNGNTGADFATLSGIISGPTGIGLRKTGAGVLRLTGANTYSGVTDVHQGTIAIKSLGNSSVIGSSSVGTNTGANLDANAITLGNGNTGAGILHYVGAGETSDRKIRFNTTTGSSQIHADGVGPLILTNVANDMVAGAKALFLRGANTAGNTITSPLTDNGGALSLTVDGGATWILSSGGNTYTGGTSVNAGALGIGHNNALGTGLLSFNNGNTFAHGGDRVLTIPIDHDNNTTAAFVGEFSLDFTQPLVSTAAGNNFGTNNNIATGKFLSFGGVTANALTANRVWTVDGKGLTIVNGNMTTSTAFGMALTKTGDGILQLNGNASNYNQAGANTDIDRGTLRLGANNAIPSGAGFGGVTLSPELAAGDTAIFDLNGRVQVINALTATTDGNSIIDNTSATAASLTFGAADSTINFGTGIGNYAIQNSGGGALSLFKAGTTSTTLPPGVVLNHTGTTGVLGGSLTLLAPLNASTGLSVTGAGSVLSLQGGLASPGTITSVSVADGSTLNLLDGQGSKLNNVSNLTLGSTGGIMTTLGLNVGDALVAGDQLGTDLINLVTGGTLNLFVGNQVTINLTDAGLFPNTTYNLISTADGGLTAGNLSATDWLLGSSPGGFSSITLNKTNNLISFTTGNLITGTLYWRGTTNNAWNGALDNWTDDKAGTIPGSTIPGQGSDVVFASDPVPSADLITTLEQNIKIQTLTFESSATTPRSVTIAPGAASTNRLTVQPSLASKGVEIKTGAVPVVNITAPFTASTAQTWTVADAFTLTGALTTTGSTTITVASTAGLIPGMPVFGPGIPAGATVSSVTDSTTLVLSVAATATTATAVTLGAHAVLNLSGGLTGPASIVKEGLGRVQVGGGGTYTGASVTVNGGSLEINAATALGGIVATPGAGSAITINPAGKFYINAAATTVSNPITLAGGTLSAAGGNHTYSSLISVPADSTIDMLDPATLNNGRNITLSTGLTGAGDLTLRSISTLSSGNPLTGTLTLNQDNSAFTGDWNLVSGTIATNQLNGLGSGANVNFEGGRIQFSAPASSTWNFTKNFSVSGALTPAVGEFSVSTAFTANIDSPLILGGAGGFGDFRAFLNTDTSFVNINGGIVLANEGRLSSGGAAGRLVNIPSVISETGGARTFRVNDEVWATTYGTVRLGGANTFTGDFAVARGVAEYTTVSDVGGPASNLGMGTNLILGGGTLRYIGTTDMSTNRPITLTGGSTLGHSGTAGTKLTYSGAISGATFNLTLTGLPGNEGFLTGGFNQTDDAADFTVNGGIWSLSGPNSRVGDQMTVTGTGVILNVENTVLAVRNDFTVTAGAVLNLNGAGVLTFNTPTLSADASLRATAGGVINLGATNAIVATEFDGLRIGVDAGGAAGVLNMASFNQNVTEFILGNRNLDREGTVLGTGTLTVTGNLDVYEGTIHANLASTGTTALEKIGAEVVTFLGDNTGLTSTGATVVHEGNLVLDYSVHNTAKIRGASALDMRGGTLTLNGSNSAFTTQDVASLTLGSGGSNYVTINPGAGQEGVLNINGNFTRANNSSDGTIRFILPAGVQSATNGITTTQALNNLGLVGAANTTAFATVQDSTGTWFATKSGNNIVPLVSAEKNDLLTWLVGDHVTDGGAGFSGAVTTGSIATLRYNAANASTANVGSSLHLATGTILVTSNVATGLARLSGGVLTSSTSEILVTQDSSRPLEISSSIQAGHAVSKSGPGILVLSGANSYTDITEIHEGTLVALGGKAVGDRSTVSLAANRTSIFQLANSEVIGTLQGGRRADGGDYGLVDVGSHTLTLNQATGATYSGFFSGTGSIVMAPGGTANFNIVNVSPGFTGSIVASGGLFQLSGIGSINASSITINRGGNFLLDNNGTTRSGTRVIDTATFTLNSADGSFSGTTVVRGLAIRTNQDATLDETVGIVTAASGASYASLEATTANDDSDIIMTDLLRQNRATLNVRGTNLGSTNATSNQFRIGNATNQTTFIGTLVGGGGAAATTNISIVPWIIGESVSAAVADANMGNSLVTYVSGQGIRPLSFVNEYNTFATVATVTDNIRESIAADISGLTGQTINALVINNSNTAAANVSVIGAGAGQTLDVTSGAMLFTATAAVTGNPAMGIILEGFDSGISVGASNEYVIFVQNPTSAAAGGSVTATINSPLISTADITKSGRGTLVLTGNNSAGGGTNRTTINEGILEIGSLGNIGGATGNLIFAGGTLRLGGAFAEDLSTRSAVFLSAGGTLDTNSVDTIFANSFGNGAGSFTKTGLGNLTLNAPLEHTGSSILAGGTVTIGVNNALGAGPLTVSGGSTLALGTNSISHTTVSTVGASPIITGTGTISASSSFNFGHTGTMTVDAVLTGAVPLIKTGTGTVTLNAINTYTGITDIQEGAVAVNLLADAGTPSPLGSPALGSVEAPIRLGLGTSTGALAYVGAANTTTNRPIALQGATGGGALSVDGTGAVDFTGGAAASVGGSKILTLTGTSAPTVINRITNVVDGYGVVGLGKTGTNVWELYGAGNTYTGQTQIDSGTLRIANDNAIPQTSAVRLGTGATAGVFDLNGFDQTIGAFTVQSTSNAVANQILIAAGKTLTVNGAVTIGVDANAATTALTASGGGSMVVNSNNGNFVVGGATGGTNDNKVTADLTGLASFTANLGTGTFRLGDINTGTEDNGSSLKLAVSNSITASTIRIGDGAGGAFNHTLQLGSGVNTLNADTLNVGSAGATIRSSGTINYDVADTTGSLILRASNGTGRATVNMVNTSGNTAGNIDGTMNLNGHNADLLISTLTMANRSVNSGVASATLSFNQGTLDVTSLLLSSRTGAGTGDATGTLNIGGGTALIGDTIMAVNTAAGGTVSAIMNLTGGTVTLGTINMANAAAGRTATSAINVGGGAVTLTASIIRTNGGGTEDASVVTTGGSLDAANFSIGSSAAPITFNPNGGTVSNLAEVNGGQNFSKTTTGALILAGTNAFTGTFNITDGSVRITSPSSLGSTVQGTVVSSGAALELSGAFTTEAEALTVAGTGIASGGAIRNISGNNTYTGAVTLSAASRVQSDMDTLVFDVASGNAITAADQDLTLGGAGNITIADGINLGTGVLTKDGTGLALLSGSSNTLGVVSVTGGTLKVDGTITSTTLTTVSGTGTLSGVGTLGPVLVNAGGTVAPGTANTIGTMSLASLTLNAGAFLSLNIKSDTVESDTINVLGNLTLSGAPTITFTELDDLPPLDLNEVLTLVTYGGGWNAGDLFTYAGNPLADDSEIVIANQVFLFNYNGGTGGNQITLTNVSNVAPTDIAVTPSAVLENAASGTVVGAITGTDPNIGHSATLSFTLVAGAGDTDNASFSIVGTNLVTSAVFDYEAGATRSIRIRATDTGTPNMTYDEAITISITDINEVPTISDIADTSTDEEMPTAALPFTLTDPEDVNALVLTGSSSNTTLIPNANITFGGTGGSRTVTVTPAPNRTGSATITVSAFDGLTTVSDTFVVTVNPFNDVPVFTAGANVSVPLTVTAPQVITGWATGIDDGDPDQSQTLTFNVSVTNDPDSIFTVPPAIDSSGNLSFTLDGVGGTATVDVSLTDDATAGGAALTSATQTFTITQAAETSSALSALALSTGTLTPVFASGTTSYTASIGVADTTLSVTPTSVGSFAMIEVRANGGTYAAVTSGSPSAAFPMNSGSNTVDLRVTAQNSTQTVYTIAVTRRTAEVSDQADVGIANDLLTNPLSISGTPTGTLSLTLVTGPANGTVTLNSDKTYRYEPNTNFIGIDSFTYQASDGNGVIGEATVTLSIVQRPPNWSWEGGSNLPKQKRSASTPGARGNMASWSDEANNRLYVFGGTGFTTTAGPGQLNDFWVCNLSTQTWTLLGGTDTLAAANSASFPGGRAGATAINDGKGNLWLFGGLAKTGPHNDLWRYNIQANTWTLVKGTTGVKGLGVYGTRGTPATGNIPGARSSAAGWADADGNLYVFGGNSMGSSGTTIALMNDLWKYDPVSNNWTWVNGSNLAKQLSVYGTKGVATSTNTPGARMDSSAWTGRDGALWMFGGSNNNDLWRYDASANAWAWISGQQKAGFAGVYRTLGLPEAGVEPASRGGARTWIDADGALVLFGGLGAGLRDDVWSYQPSTGLWTWVKGSRAAAAKPIYGALHVGSEPNTPGARQQMAVAATANGDLWSFGGINGGNSYNDLFKLDVPSVAQAVTLPALIANITNTSAVLEAQVNPNEVEATAYIRYGTLADLSNATNTSSSNVGSGTAFVAIDETVTGLTAGTKYYFQVVVTNAFGTRTGALLSFTTTGTAPAATVQFASVSSTADEAVGVTNVTVALSNPATATVTVPITITGASTASAADYTAPAGSVTFFAGQATANISIPIINDTAAESSETIVLNFGALPGGLTAGPNATHTVTITDNDAPISIDTAPDDQFIAVRETLTLSVAASGPAGLKYQWKLNTKPIKGATSATYIFHNATKSQAGIYVCDITGPAGITPTAPVKVFVLDATPKYLAVVAGKPATFTISAFGPVPTVFSYQWKKDGITNVGTNSPTFTIPATVTGDTGTYTCTVTGPGNLGSVLKDGGVNTLRVTAPVVYPAANTGTWLALAGRNAALLGNLGARLDLTTTTTGSFTALLTSQALSKAKAVATLVPTFTGPTLTGATGRAEFVRKGLSTVRLEFSLNFATNTLTGTVTDINTGANQSISGYRNVWAVTKNATTYAGQYNFALDIPVSVEGDLDVPQGNSFGSYTVTVDGKLTHAGQTADGLAYTSAGFVGPATVANGPVSAIVYAPFKAPGGVLLGNSTITPAGTGFVNSTYTGTLSWNRAAEPATSKGVTYRNGFAPVDLTIVGGKYKAPAAGQVIRGLTNADNNAKLTFVEGGLVAGQITPNPFVFSIRNTGTAVAQTVKLPVVNANKVSFKLAAKPLGQFSGTFLITNAISTLNRTAKYNGIVIWDGTQYQAVGYFLLAQLPQSGVTVTSSPILSGQVSLDP
jgi:autotransporter-associated beta strand protein